MSTDASLRSTGSSSLSNELIDRQIHNLKILTDDDQGYLFYNHKKGTFEKQTYSNWFVLALKVVFVSPWRYMFGFTSDKDYVFGGMKKLLAETELTLREKPDDEKSKELLGLIAKVKEATLPRMIKEMKEKRLFAQEAALVKLSEQIHTNAATAKKGSGSVSQFTLSSFTTSPSPLSSPHTSSSPTSSPLSSSQELSDSSEIASDLADDDIELDSTVILETKAGKTESGTEEQSNTKAEVAPAQDSPSQQPSTIPLPPHMMKGPPPPPGNFKGPPPPPGNFKGPPPPPGGLAGSKVMSKEEKITALSKVVLEKKTAYENATEKHASIKQSRITNQEQRKLNEKRKNLIKNGMQKAPKQFVTLKTALRARQEEFAKADQQLKQLQQIIERREKDLATSKSSGAALVKTKVNGNVLEVDIDLFETRLKEAKIKLNQDASVLAEKQNELSDAENKYSQILQTTMQIGDETATIGKFLGDLEAAEKSLVAIAKKQNELDSEFEKAVEELKKAQSLYVSKEKELAKLKGEESKTESIKEIKESSSAKAGADPEAIKAYHAEKKRMLVKTMSKKFSLDNLMMPTEEV
ncbi:hypothetical protein [Estrella lausannensis]|uniref:Uncharacterized protein n=1 Tax=Estrella lausannensis TaxID=483423 RepID=A0A0H5E3L9_9BACT|nr:hypothetical protein [Estrella lausannensis]CRX37810.1 hypothetical protein ELAC_0455 [Estrella lausannensis]